MPFYKLLNAMNGTYICTLQGEKEDIESYYEDQQGKYILIELHLVPNSPSEEEYDLFLYRVTDEGLDYYLLTSSVQYAREIYKIYCYSNVTKPVSPKIIRKKFYRCLWEDDKLIIC